MAATAAVPRVECSLVHALRKLFTLMNGGW